MTKPDFIPDLLFFVGALAVLAFTVGNEWSKPEVFGPKTSLSKNTGNIISSLNFNPGVKTNPPHGKPGHQCNIPVGAALTSPNADNSNNTADIAGLALKNLGNQTPLLNLTNTTPAATNSFSTAATTTGLNPAHGQPGHRCDIAVGAPLNSAPAVKQNAVTTSNATIPKNNPAHGQPYHRCDIPIGSPLDSKPPVRPAPITTPVVNSPLQVPDTTKALTYTYDSTGARLNPAHGMPGHDCTIPVGQPLKTK